MSPEVEKLFVGLGDSERVLLGASGGPGEAGGEDSVEVVDDAELVGERVRAMNRWVRGVVSGNEQGMVGLGYIS